MATLKICPACSDAATLICKGCQGITYCSKECQEADWPSHKLLCKTFAQVKEPPPGTQDMFRVLYFPANGSKPELLWLKKWTCDEEDVVQRSLQDQIGVGFGCYKTMEKNVLTEVELGYEICICYNGNSHNDDDLADNEAVTEATSGLASGWRGPLLAYVSTTRSAKASDAMSSDAAGLSDMSLADYSHTVAWLISACSDKSPAFYNLPGPKVTAVKLLCGPKSERESNVQSISLPRLHPALRKAGLISPISKLIGMALVCAQLKTPKQTDPTNSASGMMLLCVDPTATEVFGFGLPPLGRSQPRGDMIVFREDFQPLTAAEAYRFGKFCLSAMMRMSRTCELSNRISRQEALAGITEQTWQEFKADWERDPDSAMESMSNRTVDSVGGLAEEMGNVEFDNAGDPTSPGYWIRGA